MTYKDYRKKFIEEIDKLPESLYGRDYGSEEVNLVKNNPWAWDRRKKLLRKIKYYYNNNAYELTILDGRETFHIVIGE